MSRVTVLLLLVCLALVVVAAAPFVGIESVPLRAVWSQQEQAAALVLWKIRVPRVAMALLAGAALSSGGAVFQSLFRNPLAEPYTLGVSAGAALGAVLSMQLEVSPPLWGLSAVSLGAFIGAGAVVAFVYALARLRRDFSVTTMLLAGVAISFFCSSLILLVQYLSDFTRTLRMLRWTMGGLESVVGMAEVLQLLPFVVTGCLLAMYLSHELNLLSTGEELAASRGVEVQHTKIVLLATAALMVGAVVSLCGPIGFVGLMTPHICRLLVGADHRWLLPATILLGGPFLVICDTIGRTVMAPVELPVGIITALLGGPFFLWLLLSRRPAGG